VFLWGNTFFRMGVDAMSWQDTIKTLAPTVATALLGPMGGAAISAIGTMLGIDSPTQDKIASAIESGKLTPDQVAELKKLEMQYINDEKERGFKYSELEFKDTQGAREMQIATHSYVPPILAMTVTVGFFAILIGMLLNSQYKPTEPLLVMLGSLGTAWTMIVGFYFGSSHGSQKKDALLAESTPRT
jgi:hypothetical protein